MCMSDALWAGVDRVVYGATIADANRFTRQIRIPATEVAQRSDMKTVVWGRWSRRRAWRSLKTRVCRRRSSCGAAIKTESRA
jgi:tRNA(Arg) A34 adenosine deaminase TadA